jgi:mono/diheme cytochrome c family protein
VSAVRFRWGGVHWGLVVAAAALLAFIAGVIWIDHRARSGGDAWSHVPDLRDAQRIAAGERVYASHCAACHGAQLEGQPNWTTRRDNGRLPAPPHDESGHTWHHPSTQLFELTKHGLAPPHAPAGYQSDMPAFKDVLSDDDIWAVLAYIKSRWPAQVRERHDGLDAQVRAQDRAQKHH